jgi:putative Ca2+/H+ antiporter (TMEM165/GDT1 family)
VDLKLFATVFSTVLLAELGDKTQLATLLYAAQGENPRLTVFVAASAALVLTSALGVLAGDLLSRVLDPGLLVRVAGLGFIGVGVWILVRA